GTGINRSRQNRGARISQMLTGSPLLTFSISLSLTRSGFVWSAQPLRNGLRASAELDVASRIKREMGVGVAPCTVLFVDDPTLLLEGIVFHRGAALGIPQPVV